MTTPLTVRGPAGFAPEVAIAFGSQDGPATAVDASNPLPVSSSMGASGAAALTGTTSAASATLGPFVPRLGRAIWVSLSGSWSGSVQLLRSTDGGTTKSPLTYGDGGAKPAWTGALNAPVAEETVSGATYYLGVTLASGSLSYRVEQ